MKAEIRINIVDLEAMIAHFKNRAEYGNMKRVVYATIEQHPNGRPYLQLEQPCHYGDCNSGYWRFDGDLPKKEEPEEDMEEKALAEIEARNRDMMLNPDAYFEPDDPRRAY